MTPTPEQEARKAAAKRADILTLLPPAPRVAGTKGGEFHGPCPKCHGSDRMIIQPHHPQGGRARCRQCADQWMDTIDLVQWLGKVSSYPAALDYLTGPAPRIAYAPTRPAPAKPTARAPRRAPDVTHDYTEGGVLRYQVVRWQLTPDEAAERDGRAKWISQRRPDGRGGWIWNLDGVAPLLYRLDDVLAADPAAPIWIPEGEKDVDRLWSLGLPAICNSGGAKHWPAGRLAPLAGRRAIILPDNDPMGEEHAAQVLAEAQAAGLIVTVLRLPGLPDKGDVSDWLDSGHSPDALALVAQFAEAQPPPVAAPTVNPATGEIQIDAATLAAVEAERDELQFWKDKTLDILFGGSGLELSDRVSLIAFQYLADSDVLPVGQEGEFSGQKAAERLHISESTVSRYVDRWQTMGLVEHRVTPGEQICDKKGRPRFTPNGEPLRKRQAYLSCKATPFEVETTVLISPPGKKGAQHGGRRACPHCGADGSRQEIITRRRCLDCGAEYEHDEHGPLQLHDETTESLSDCNMKPEGAPGQPLPLRGTAEGLRRRAGDSPEIAGIIRGVRNRLAVADLDAAAGEYAHDQLFGPQFQDETTAPPLHLVRA